MLCCFSHSNREPPFRFFFFHFKGRREFTGESHSPLSWVPCWAGKKWRTAAAAAGRKKRRKIASFMHFLGSSLCSLSLFFKQESVLKKKIFSVWNPGQTQKKLLRFMVWKKKMHAKCLALTCGISFHVPNFFKSIALGWKHRDTQGERDVCVSSSSAFAY